MPEQLFEQILTIIVVLALSVCAVIYVDGRWGR